MKQRMSTLAPSATLRSSKRLSALGASAQGSQAPANASLTPSAWGPSAWAPPLRAPASLAQSALATTALALAGLLCFAGPVSAQVAGGSTTVGVSVTESTQLAMGWSVKKTLMGKAIYNDTGDQIGKVEDLIISPEKNVSYVIVGAGGFVGIGRHDVAVPVSQIRNQSGRLIMAGATKASIKALPSFDDVDDPARRAQFIATAEKDIAMGHKRVTELRHKAATLGADVKLKLETQAAALEGDVKSAESRMSELRKAADVRWTALAADVSAATVRIRQAL